MPSVNDIQEAINNVSTTALSSHTQQISAAQSAIATNITNIATKLPKTVSLVTPTRTLDTVFQISTDYPALVIYTIEMDITFSLLSSQSAGVSLLSDENNPPMTVISRVISYGNQTLGLAITTNTIQRQPVFAYVPVGNYVKLLSNGAGNVSIYNQLEILFSG